MPGFNFCSSTNFYYSLLTGYFTHRQHRHRIFWETCCRVLNCVARYRLRTTSGANPHTTGCGMRVCTTRDLWKGFHDVSDREVTLFTSWHAHHVRHTLTSSYANFAMYQATETGKRVSVCSGLDRLEMHPRLTHLIRTSRFTCPSRAAEAIWALNLSINELSLVILTLASQYASISYVSNVMLKLKQNHGFLFLKRLYEYSANLNEALHLRCLQVKQECQ